MVDNGDDNIYIAGYLPAKLLRYNKTSKTITVILDLPAMFPERKHRFIWDIISVSGVLYFSGDFDPYIYKYEPATEELTMYNTPLFPNGYFRSLAYYNERLYAGTGSDSHLFEIDPVNDTFIDILPSNLLGTSGITYLKVLRNTLIYTESKFYDQYGYNFSTKQTTKLLGNNLSDPNPDAVSYIPGYTVFTGFSDLIYQFNKTKLLRTNTPFQPLVGTHLSGNIASGITRRAEYNIYNGNELTLSLELSKAGLTEYPGRTFNACMLNDKVISSGHKIRVRDLITNKVIDHICLGEPKVLAANPDYLYTANYTHAAIWRYPVADLTNPSLRFDLNKYKYFVIPKQNRPICLIADVNKIIVCSEPEYGLYGGALSIIYFNNTNLILTSIFKRHTPTFCCLIKDMIYVITSATGGSGALPLNEPARLIKYNITNKSVVFDKVIDPLEFTLTSIAANNENLFITGSKGDLYITDFNGNIKTINTSFNFNRVYSLKNDIYVTTSGSIFSVTRDTYSSLFFRKLVTTRIPHSLMLDSKNKLYWINDDDMLCTIG